MTFPAVIIGGPPHSGKSVLVYSLTQALRHRGVAHYVLRACPDGEGDWANEAEQELVRKIRNKGQFTAAFASEMAELLRNRHLPLLVDVGGKLTPEQETLFPHCTHAVLLVADDPQNPATYQESMQAWQTMLVRQGVTVIAQIKSVLTGPQQLVTTRPVVSGVLSGLIRGQTAQGPVVEALVDRMGALFTYTEQELAAQHMADAPVELALNLPALARTLGAATGRWEPAYIPRLLDYLPEHTPLALYGRAPIWIYAALAVHALPAPIWLFDARLGWLQPPHFSSERSPRVTSQAGWQVVMEESADHVHLAFTSHSQMLDPEASDQLPLPEVAPGRGLVLSGKLPNWGFAGIARQLARKCKWLAIYQPSLGAAVVVLSRTNDTAPGNIWIHSASTPCLPPSLGKDPDAS